MSKKTDRRTFFKKGLAIGATAIAGAKPIARLLAASPTAGGAITEGTAANANLVVAKGNDYFATTQKALAALGGMEKFVSRGSRVGLLVNAPPWWKLPGSHTNTDIVLATLQMCLNAGAKEVRLLFEPSSDLWSRSPLSGKFTAEIKGLQPFSRNYVETPVKAGVALKTAKVIKELLECDAWIDLPIAKHHTGTNFSGCLKNFMAALQGSTNHFFHSGSGAKGAYDDVDFLSQCIADANTLRRPALCIADATVVLAANGPAGPGELLRSDKVVAGSDAVAVDTYCAGLLGRRPDEILMLKKASAHGIGQTDLSKLNIAQITA